MVHLVFSELRHNLRLWLGAFIIISSAALFLTLSAGIISTGLTLRGTGQISAKDFEGIVGFAATPAALATVTTAVVITSVAQLTVSEQRHSYALWQLAGVLPRRVTGVVMRQLAVLSLLAATAGVLAGWPLVSPLFDWLGARVPSLAGLDSSLSPAAAAIVVAFSVLLTLTAGLRPARTAGRTPPIVALRSPETLRGVVSIMRWIWCALLVFAGVALSIGIQSIPLSGVGSNGFLIPFLFGCAVACAGPVVVPLVLRSWTAAFRTALSSVWFLARNASRHRVGQSASTVVPLSLGLILVCSFMSVFAMFQQALSLASGPPGPPIDVDTAGNLLIYGAPLVLATLAAAVTVFMSGRARERENALVLAAGGTPSTVVITAALEAVIYTATAAILSLLVLIPALATVWAAMNSMVPGTPFVVSWASWAAVAGAGLIALLVSTIIPTLYSMRSSIQSALSS